MLVAESRILQVCIFKTLRSKLGPVDLAIVLTDVMTIADEVDSQLRQTMASPTNWPIHMRQANERSSAARTVAYQLGSYSRLPLFLIKS